MNRAFPARIGVDVWILKFWAQIRCRSGQWLISKPTLIDLR